MSDPPRPVAEQCASLAAIGGVGAVAIGGCGRQGTADDSSDWDIGLSYRGGSDLGPLARHGEMHPPGSWGRIMDGGAWLTIDGLKVDVMRRDLDVVRYWTEAARQGRYEVDALLGYAAGAPTYGPAGEFALSRLVTGTLPAVAADPEALVQAGDRRSRGHADFSLADARMWAERGDVVGAVGQVAKAITETAHVLACRGPHWVHNEKRVGLGEMRWLTGAPRESDALLAWVGEIGAAPAGRSTRTAG